MGSQMSKTPGNQSKMKYSVRAYENTCKVDPDVKKFDEVLQTQTGHTIRALANGIEVRSLSLESLREIIDCLLKMDKEVVKVLWGCEEDICNNPVLFKLVEEYFENSLKTLDFCTELENSLKKARNNQLIIENALKQIPLEGPPLEAQCKKMLEEFNHFKTAGNPFSEDFVKHFDSIRRRHTQMLMKLQRQKKTMYKKLRRIRAWRKVSSIIFVATFAAVLICSVVAAAIFAPPIAAAIAAVVPIVPTTGKWIDSYWKEYEDAIKVQRKTGTAMEVGTIIVIDDLERIRDLVENLEDNIDFYSREEDALRLRIEVIKEKQESFMKAIQDLADSVDQCSRNIRKARTMLQKKMTRSVRKSSLR